MKILYKPHIYSQQRQREKERFVYPVLLAMEAEYHRQTGHEVWWDLDGFQPKPNRMLLDKIITEPEGLPFLELPSPDRVFTGAKDKSYQQNGNFKYRPGTYIMSASGCWHGKCTFCVEKDKPYIIRPVDSVIEEIKQCKAQGFKEVFDDAATFSYTSWFTEFCKKLEPIGIKFGCNMRFGTLHWLDYKNMGKAGFRMILWGLESANQKTLDRIRKGINIEQVEKELMISSRYGLENHLCVIFGYYWETDKEAVNTLRFVHKMLRKGYIRTAQASFYDTPEPGAKHEHKKYIPKIYNAGYYPDFWFNQLKHVRNLADINYIWRGIKEALKWRKGE